jgi:hypothetical protein
MSEFPVYTITITKRGDSYEVNAAGSVVRDLSKTDLFRCLDELLQPAPPNHPPFNHDLARWESEGGLTP